MEFKLSKEPPLVRKMVKEFKQEQLKPCPFCGGEAVIIETGRPYAPIKYFVTCVDCGIETPRIDRTKEKVVELWNTRKPMDRLVRQLVEEIKGYGQGLDLVDERPYESYVQGKIMAYEEVIEIVKGGAE